jgi:hypothetical protein
VIYDVMIKIATKEIGKAQIAAALRSLYRRRSEGHDVVGCRPLRWQERPGSERKARTFS